MWAKLAKAFYVVEHACASLFKGSGTTAESTEDMEGS